MLSLPCYGVHWLEGDIAVLYQGGAGETVIGLKLDTKLNRKSQLRCNHEIDLNATVPIPEGLAADPLVQALAPVPRPRGAPVPYFDNERVSPALYRAMAQMSAPVGPMELSINYHDRDRRIAEVQRSNIQPLIITGLNQRYRISQDNILITAQRTPRPITMFGNWSVVMRVEGIKRTTELTDEHINLPWREIGASLLREYMLDQTNASR